MATQLVAVKGSTITKVKVVKVNHTWNVENFAFCGGATGEFISSMVFSANGDESTPKWRLKMYPNGAQEEDKEFTSLFLSLVSSAKKTHKVDTSFSIISSGRTKINTLSMEKVFTVGKSWGWAKFMKRDTVIKSAGFFLPNGHLTIMCEISYTDDTIVMPGEVGIEVPPSGALQADLSSLLESGTLSDVTLQVEGVQLPAHKAVLAARSPVFRAMFDHDVRERRENAVKITDLKADVVREMLMYIYTDTAPNANKMAADLLAAADKYDLGRLQLICEDVLSRELNVNNIVEVLELADEHNAEHLKKRCMEFLHMHAAEIAKSPNWKAVKQSNPAFHLLDCYIVSTLPSSDEKSMTPPKKKCRYQ